MRWSDRLRLSVASGSLAALALVTATLAAEPSPSGAVGGDARSAGAGPGLVGDPLWAIVIVAAITVVSLLGTLAWARATAQRSGPPQG